MEAAGAPGEGESAGRSSRGRRGGSHSGRLLLRMPEELHAALARASEREGVSLNAYITGVLGEAVEERPPGGGSRKRAPGASTSSPAAPRARGVSRLLVVNLVVVAIVGVLAVVLLVQALR